MTAVLFDLLTADAAMPPVESVGGAILLLFLLPLLIGLIVAVIIVIVRCRPKRSPSAGELPAADAEQNDQ